MFSASALIQEHHLQIYNTPQWVAFVNHNVLRKNGKSSRNFVRKDKMDEDSKHTLLKQSQQEFHTASKIGEGKSTICIIY